MTDITLNIENGYFIYRVGAIIIHDNKVLMVKNDRSPYYYSVGGRVGFGETSESAVLREAFEETGVDFEIDRLAFIHENIFHGDFFNNALCHEISFYYLMKQNENSNTAKGGSLGINGVTESLHWLRLDELPGLHLYPEFYKTELQNLKNEVGHFITMNEHTIRTG